MSLKKLALNKINLIICGISVLIIVIGFVLMNGSSTTVEGGFNPDIYSVRRIKVAPLVCVVGFILMIVGILYPAKSHAQKGNEQK